MKPGLSEESVRPETERPALETARAFLVTLRALAGPILILLIGLALFCGVDQVIDCMRTALSDLGWHYIVYQAFTVWWAVQLWYVSRTLLHVAELRGKAERYIFVFFRWLPRLTGAGAFAVAFAAFAAAGTGLETNLTTACSVNAALLAAYLLFVTFRRRLFGRRFHPKELGLESCRIRWTSIRDLRRNWFPILLSFIIFAVFFLAFLVSRVTVPQTLGAPAIILSALSFWSLLALWISDLDRRTVLPLRLALLIAFVVFGFMNDNHEIRLLPEPAPGPVSPELGAYFTEWAGARIGAPSGETSPGPDRGEPYRVYLVAAEGGGIRSAYWVARYLAALDERSGYEFGTHVFAISGVSGGSLGAAAYAALAADRAAGNTSSFTGAVRRFLGTDFFAPVVASMFYGDLFQRFIPVPFPELDRARSLEAAWETGWERLERGTNRFTEPFVRLRSADTVIRPDHGVPSLFFSGTRVEDGKRVVAGTLRLGGACPDAVELETSAGTETFARLRTSTAVLLTARFPYITPAGRIPAQGGGIWGSVADGGYFENSGAATLYDILRHLDSGAVPREALSNLEFQVIALTNDTPAADTPSTVLTDLLQPIGTFLNAWTARSPYTLALLEDYIETRNREQERKPGNERLPLWSFDRVNLPISERDVPLGWTLSERAMNEIDRYVEELLGPETPQPSEVRAYGADRFAPPRPELGSRRKPEPGDLRTETSGERFEASAAVTRRVLESFAE